MGTDNNLLQTCKCIHKAKPSLIMLFHPAKMYPIYYKDGLQMQRSFLRMFMLQAETECH